jgi:hypothetical protein
MEHFSSDSAEVKHMINAWATWDPKQPPIAGRQYNPTRGINNSYPVPPDLNRAPVSKPGAYPPGALPTTADNKQPNTPGLPPNSRQTMAQSKDLSELDSKIMTWLEAASQREHEKPGSLTPQQLGHRIILQARLEDIRQQLGTNNITDNYLTVINETKALRRENAGWQHQAPFVSAAFEYGNGVNPDSLLTKEQYDRFFDIFGEAIKELKNLYQPDPLQKVRYQQLQVIRQSLIDSSSPTNPPPIRMGSAQLFLRQMLRPEQPLPTLYSLNYAPSSLLGNHSMNPDDVMDYLRNVQWKLTMSYDPADQEMKRAAASLMDRLRSGGISVMDARSMAATIDSRLQPMAFIAPGSHTHAPVPPRRSPSPSRKPARRSPSPSRKPARRSPSPPKKIPNRRSPSPPKKIPAKNKMLPPVYSGFVGSPTDIISGAQRLCRDVTKAFPKDAKALGCSPVTTKFQAETVINVVCNNIRSSVPSVSPEQFNCPALKQLIKADG